MRRLNLFVSEAPALPISEGEDSRGNLGTNYVEPFAVELSTWAFSARVLDALARHAWQPTQDAYQLNIVLTPALAEGESKMTLEHEDFRELYVGLSRER
jgi:hypothetical protein